MSILDFLQLNESQERAVATPGDVLVTAGAGSGKTRTLVGRYLYHLEQGAPLRGIVAITFTEKAAREMRTRIRQTIDDWLAQVDDPDRRSAWEALFADLDAARIGTIHSLCAQVLREHPVEAARWGVDPGFGVLEEGRAAVLRARAVEDALAWAAEDEAASHLFGALGEFGLRTAAATLLEQRLDADAAFERLGDDPLDAWTEVLLAWLDERLSDPGWREPLDALSRLQADDPSDKMAVARQETLAHADAAIEAQRRGDAAATLAALAEARAATTLYGRKGNWPGDALAEAKEATRALRAYFDERLAPLADPKKGAVWALDEAVAGLIWPLHATYRRARELYAQARRAENGLDFDDLEAGALALLREPAVRAVWQEKVQAVLVDEFQDTNERQREIVYALVSADSSDALFVVGDAKQSIYRFRGADVTVFRRVQEDVSATGEVVALDLTFRAHRGLVETVNRLLAPVMGEAERPGRPYEVPFAPLRAYRTEPKPGVKAPYVEFHLGLGERAHEGRRAAADGLAERLLALREHEGIDWADVALLFRASTAFSVYEDGLERAGIPFVTVAGRGFYERYEVRALLNALQAAADPADDLALVGFLRSPAVGGVGLSDATLYLLRFPPSEIVPREEDTPCAIWSILHHPALPDIVPPDELARALQGRDLIAELHDLAGRVSVAALLKRLLDQSGYRAAVRATGGPAGGPRALRNVDKLLVDAHASGLVSVRAFAEYVRALRDVGARESEAPTEAGSAVQLMTVHKAKGLEFPVVVIADASHGGHWRSAGVLLDERLGVVVSARDEDGRRPAAYGLAAVRDGERDAAEDRRLLYVAATRAEEKLLVSGYTKVLKGGGLSLRGWLDLLGPPAGLDGVTVAGTPVAAQVLDLAADVGCTLYPGGEQRIEERAERGERERGSVDEGARGDLVAPLVGVRGEGDEREAREEREVGPPSRVWRVAPTAQRPTGPAWVVGSLFHAALRYWRFPDEGDLEAFLRPFALQAGLTDPREIKATISEARRLLARFQAAPIYARLDQVERYHEAPYTLVLNGRARSGVVDLLCRIDGEWTVVEFKTDELSNLADVRPHIERKGYDRQMREYVAAVTRLVGERPRGLWVFVNVGGGVVEVPFDPPVNCGRIQ